MSRAVIISAGEIKDFDYIKSFVKKDDFVICADGGARHAEMMGIEPSLTVGDFDSFDGQPRGEVRQYNREKDFTDTDIAVKAALDYGYKDIVMLGATGKRLDHTLANIGLLEYIALNGGTGQIIDEYNTVTVIRKNTILKPEPQRHLSLVAIGEAKGITLENLKYSLKDYDLKFSQSLAVSNEFTDKDARIMIKDGSLIVIKSRD